jgi:pantothenate kinase type III
MTLETVARDTPATSATRLIVTRSAFADDRLGSPGWWEALIQPFRQGQWTLNNYGVVMGSVVPTVTETFREMCERYFPFPPVMVEPGIRTGIALRYDNPREIGADRIANAVAAQALYRSLGFSTVLPYEEAALARR